MMRNLSLSRAILLMSTLLALLLSGTAMAHEPDYTGGFDPDRCNFSSTGSNPYFPLWPGYQVVLEGEEEDDEGELVEISATITVLAETEMVQGIQTRVVEERELEDGELVEVSRNFFAMCRETGDVWYFGEDVDDYEDGEIVGHEGAWRAGVAGAKAGIQMLGTPTLGARYFEEEAPGVALDRGEVLSLDETVNVPLGTYEHALLILDTNALAPEEAGGEKFYAPGVGVVADEALQLVELTPPPCQPDETTHCLNNGRFKVQVEWDRGPDDDDDDGDEGEDEPGDEGDDDGDEVGPGRAILASDISGEFWFFSPGNTELLVKVIDACTSNFNSFWVFAAGLTDVEVELTVTDTATGIEKEYEHEAGSAFQPILDTQAFSTCP